MINTRLLSIIRNKVIQIAWDSGRLILARLTPIMQFFMLEYATTNDVRRLPMAVSKQDLSVATTQKLCQE